MVSPPLQHIRSVRSALCAVIDAFDAIFLVAQFLLGYRPEPLVTAAFTAAVGPVLPRYSDQRLAAAEIADDHLSLSHNRVDVIRPPLQHLCPLLSIFRTIIDAGNAALFMA